MLSKNSTFHFSTFGFPVLECHVKESVPPSAGLAWEDREEEAMEMYHAWLIKDLSNGRVRVLTQESQTGRPAEELAGMRPDVMLLGHQDRLNALVAKARVEEVVREETNPARVGLLAY
jgi:hypothetical protein